MGENKGSFIVTVIVMLVIFLSWISIVFGLQNGKFFKFELVLLILLLLSAINLTAGIVRGNRKWKGLILFYLIIWVNLLIIYFTRFSFTEIFWPFVISGIGYLIALVKADATEFDKEFEEIQEVPVEEKKPAKRKRTKKGKK